MRVLESVHCVALLSTVVLLLPHAAAAQAPVGPGSEIEVYAEPPPGSEEAETIEVVGRRWDWRFRYPNGLDSHDLRLPQGRWIRLRLTSEDVAHPFVVPELGLAAEVHPGQPTDLWIRAPGGVRSIAARVDSGDRRPVPAHVLLVGATDYQRFLDTWGGENDLPPAQRGEQAYQRLGCSACHPYGGSRGFAGTPVGLWGSDLLMADGSTVTVSGEEGCEFLRQSVLHPNAKVTAGYFSDGMAGFLGHVGDEEIDALIAFIRCLGADGCADPACADVGRCI